MDVGRGGSGRREILNPPLRLSFGLDKRRCPLSLSPSPRPPTLVQTRFSPLPLVSRSRHRRRIIYVRGQSRQETGATGHSNESRALLSQALTSRRTNGPTDTTTFD